jgi:hypothetical protein
VVDSDSGPEAGQEASPPEGGEGSIPTEGGDGPLPEAGGDADAAQCPSIEDYCATDASPCVSGWSVAQNASSWCTPPSRRIFLYPNCHGYNLVVDAGVDTSVIYSYDATTMRLVGIEHRGFVPPPLRCVAGAPPGIDLSTCGDGSTPHSLCDSVDAGCAAPNVLRYTAPGCGVDAHPVCGSPTQDACGIAVCSCTGHTILRCDFSPEPFAHSGSCEDAADASTDGH